METKNNGLEPFVLLVIGFVIGLLFSFLSITNVHASSSDFNYMMTEYKLQQKKGYEFVCLYNSKDKTYKLIEYQDKNAYFTDEKYYINGGYMGGVYTWVGNTWVADYFGVNNYIPSTDQYILYSSCNLKNEKGGIYFYKTNSILTNEIYHGISTELNQKISSSISILIPIVLVVFATFIGIYLVPKILHKFV